MLLSRALLLLKAGVAVGHLKSRLDADLTSFQTATPQLASGELMLKIRTLPSLSLLSFGTASN